MSPLISPLRRLWQLRKGRAGAAAAPREHVVLPDDAAVIYAVGDVHGCYDQLVRLDQLIVADGQRVPGRKFVVMLGDYVDRGPNSAAVIDHLLQAMPEGFTRVCLYGNHEQMMLRFLDDPVANKPWLDFGGAATMSSYGLDIWRLMRVHGDNRQELARVLQASVPPEHVAFLRRLPVLARAGIVVFAHAGVRPGIPLARQNEMDLLWIREPFLSEGPGLPMIVIHGHTPTPRPSLAQNRLCADTGAYSTGRLTAVRCQNNVASLISAYPNR